MGSERIKLHRDKLYEMVWEKPMTVLAKEYGLSDVGLRKICKKMNIPLPPQGYHLRTHKGKKTPLPPAGKHEQVYEAYINRLPEEVDGSKNTKGMEEVDFEKAPANKIVVDENPVSQHKLVQVMRKHINARKNQSANPNTLLDLDSGSFITVSKGTVDRALRIADSLLKALEVRGYKVCVDKGYRLSHVIVLDEEIIMSIQEPNKQVPYKPTPEEVREHKKYSWMTYPKYDYVKSGELIIKLTGATGQSTVSDKVGKPLEKQLNEVVIRMLRLAVRMRNDRLERERKAKEGEQRRNRYNELVRLHEQEKAMLEELYRDSSEWHKSQQLRAYIEAVRQKEMRAGGGIQSGSDLDEWIRWAHQQADRLDPLVESPYSVLDERLPSYWAWSG